ncbi:MAG: hypothetical protein HY554_15285 [Elusimicrobia bacterium]|nr:hypothetical protein [Elusimicrobiota bacterium]
MEKTARRAGWALILSLAIQQTGHADGLKSMAKELSKAAERAGVSRVAIVAFEPADAAPSREGWGISERLTTHLVRRGRVHAVERALLTKLMDETRLGETGALALPELSRVGRLLSVEAVVTGSFALHDRAVVINARLIRADTGEILAAVERKAPRTLRPGASTEGPEEPLVAPEPLYLPQLIASSDLRDSIGSVGCEDAAERVDRLEGLILDVKARHWAGRLKSGLPLSEVRYNPGSTISDPALKREFYDRMRHWYAQASIPAPTPPEARRFAELDGTALRIFKECGL